uniref:Leucine rich repeat containing 3C n=1 Tax=Lates calcarifer TaxID=8187 RepID=A0A4W6BTR1_LATCA
MKNVSPRIKQDQNFFQWSSPPLLLLLLLLFLLLSSSPPPPLLSSSLSSPLLLLFLSSSSSSSSPPLLLSSSLSFPLLLLHHSLTMCKFPSLTCPGVLCPQVPVGLSNLTIRLFLDKNLLSFLPTDSFSDLFQLQFPVSSQLSSLEAGCFRGLESSLRFLDLSSNWLSALDPAALGGLRAAANLTHNPWHCDCRMQLDLDPSSLNEVVCQTSDLPNLAVGMPLVLLVEDWDLCLSVRRTTDVVMLVTMFLWFSMVIFYLVCYIRQNQEDARRHVEYLKSLQSHQV